MYELNTTKQSILSSEKWESVLNWPAYEVSNMGNVRGRYGRIKTFSVQGYLTFNVSKKRDVRASLRVHREVLRSFVGDSELCCCHNDGDKLNNHLTNLRWDTHKGNEADKVEHGTKMQGESHHQSKLTKMQAIFVKTSSLGGAELARKFGISRSQIYNIRKSRSWRSLCSF